MPLINKDKYIWDFWYLYDEKNRMFDVFFLNADKIFAKKEQHHFHSVVGRSKTINWVDFFNFEPDYFGPDLELWDNTSIWSGDTIKHREGSIIFYTSRDKDELDGTVQHIGIASIDATGKPSRTRAKISAPAEFYLTHTDHDEKSIHCWRDPFIFYLNDSIYMLVAAKRKDFPVNERGCIALMELVDEKDITRWRHKRTIVSTNCAEVELPQIYKTTSRAIRIFFNAKMSDGSKHFFMTNEFFDVNENKEIIRIEKDILEEIYEKDKYYGLRIIPERNNIICAFNQNIGCVEVVFNLSSMDIGKVFQIKPNL